MNELEIPHFMLCNSNDFEYTLLSRVCDVKILRHCYQVKSRIMYTSMSSDMEISDLLMSHRPWNWDGLVRLNSHNTSWYGHPHVFREGLVSDSKGGSN